MTSLTVRLQPVRSIPLAVIRRRAKASELSRVVPQCCGLVWNALRSQKVEAGRNVAIYWDGGIRLEVGAEIFGPFLAEREVVAWATPAGTAATATYFGPYPGLGAAHQAVREWCKNNNHTLADPNWEIYAHWQSGWNNDPSQIRTDVYYQLSA